MRGWRLEIGALLVLLIAGGLWQLSHEPLEQSRPEAEQAAAAPPLPPAGRGAPYVLLLDPRTVAARATLPLAQRDWSFAWLDWFEQELGPFRLLEPAALGTPSGELSGVALVVVSRSAWPGLTPAGRAALAGLVTSGGVVLAEAPPAGTTVPGVAGSGSVSRAVVLEEPFTTALVRLQQGWIDEPAAPGAPPALPPPPPLPGLPPGRIATEALAAVREAEPRLPVADLLERELLLRVEALRPLARWWPFPDAAAGVVALTYEQAGVEDAPTWMVEHDNGRAVPGTFFATPGALDRRRLEQIVALAGPPSLDWQRGYEGHWLEVRWGLGPLLTFWRPASLLEQRQRLAGLAPGTPLPSGCRAIGTVWDPEFGRTFRIQTAAGIQWDSSYGPLDPGRGGYLFGTGLPFHPLDGSGRAFRLYEVPFVLRNDGRYDPELQDALLAGSAAGHHQLLTVLLHAGMLQRSPGEGRMEAWLTLPAQLAKRQHLLMTVPRFLAHWQARLASPLTLRWDAAAGTLRVEAVASVAGLTLALTAEQRGEAMLKLELDGQSLPASDWQRRSSSVLLPLTPGPHTVLATYPRREK